MARGCTCALFSSGPAFLKIFPAAAARRFKSPGRSRRFSSGGKSHQSGQTIQKLALRHRGSGPV